MNFNHLYYFFIVSQEGSLSQAARRLRVSQPALSMQIQALERSLGRQLFVRSPRGLKLTASGKLVLRHARRMFEHAQALREALEVGPAEAQGLIRVGVAEDIERPFSVRLMHRALPGNDARIRLVANAHDELVLRLRRERLDVLISDRSEEDLVAFAKCEMPVVLVAAPALLPRPQAALTGTQALKLAAGIGLAAPTRRFALRRDTDLFLQKTGFDWQLKFEGDQLASVVQAVIDGLGAGFLPLPYVREAVLRGELRQLGPEGFWNQGLWLLGKRTRRRHPLVDELKRLFRTLVDSTEARPRAA